MFKKTIINYNLVGKIFQPFTIHIPNITDVPGTQSIKGIKEYKNRLIPILPPTNKLLLPLNQYENSIQLINYFREYFYSPLKSSNLMAVPLQEHTPLSQGINTNDDVLRELQLFPGHQIAEFYASDAVAEIARKVGKKLSMAPSIAKVLNNKAIIREIFKGTNVLVPDGNMITKSSKNFYQELHQTIDILTLKGYQEFSLTEINSCSGQGIHRFKQYAEIESVIETLNHTESFLLEGWMSHVVSSPSFQMFLTENLADCCIFSYTEQLLVDDVIHSGNIKLTSFLEDENFKNTIQTLFTQLHQRHARGIVGVDLLVCFNEAQEKLNTYLVEVNARQTGAIYGALFAYELLREKPEKQWLIHNNVNIQSNIFLETYISQLHACNLHFNTKNDKGIIVLSNGNFKNNKAMILCIADSRDELFEFLHAATITQHVAAA